MTTAPDRLEQLLQQNAITGIDFIYIYQDQVNLDIYFFQHANPPQPPAILGVLSPDKIRIYDPDGGEGLPEIPVSSTAWASVDGRDVLHVTVTVPGNFTNYKIRIADPKIDLYYNDVPFSFKANCPTDLDCEPDEGPCPPEDLVDFPVDYRARDFNSFRQALLEFASQRYPDWQDRLEADQGMMLVEVMSALGDELAYYQDRVAREAYLESASQRRSIRRHARLVDYEVHNGLAASSWLDVTVQASQAGDLPGGADIWSLGDDGRQISFEVGRGLKDRIAGRSYHVDAKLNSLQPHIWDEDDLCLPVGATSMYIKGKQSANLVFDDPPEDPDGKWVLLITSPADPAVSERRWLIRVIQTSEERDEIFNEDITRIEWETAQALPYEVDLSELEVRANLVPATAGRTVLNRFVVGAEPTSLGLPDVTAAGLRRAVERSGADQAIDFLFSLIEPELLDEDQGKPEAEDYLLGLDKPESSQLTWLGDQPPYAAPEIYLEEVTFDGVQWQTAAGALPWEWRQSLLGVNSSLPEDRHYTLEDGTWDRVVGYWRSGQEIVHVDYRSGEGFSVRFGDGEFGLAPPEKTIFQASYRLGNGRRTNVAADSLTYFDPSLTFIESVTNPLAAAGGQDPESFEQVRQQAPEAFRYITYRAVQPDDYAEAVERLPWVQRAGAQARWTGSWLTMFATPDPEGAVVLAEDQRVQATQQLDRFRQAGREAWINDPKYADLDLKITICVQPYAYPGEVKEAVLNVLLDKPGLSPGFFSPDNFTFGDPLRRSVLESVIQAVPGVRAVEGITIRRQGWFDWRDFSEMAYEVAIDEVIRVENDPLHPRRGTLQLIMEGGA